MARFRVLRKGRKVPRVCEHLQAFYQELREDSDTINCINLV